MSNDGWIKLHRKLLDNSLWIDCNANQKVVMITILLRANHEPKKWVYKGQEYVANAGEFVTSLSSLCSLTGLKTNIVRNTLDKLEKYNFITRKTTSKNTLIKVENWELYQSKDNEDDKENNKEDNKDLTSQTTKEITKTSQRPNKDPTTNKNDKNYKNNIYSASDDTQNNSSTQKNSSTKQYEVFEKIWSMYPAKKGKSQVSKKSKEQIEKLGIGKMEKALQRYVDDVKKQRKQGFSSLRYKNGSTWFNSGYEDYLTEESNVTPIKKEPAKIVYVNRGYL